jgi:hypothetical protein
MIVKLTKTRRHYKIDEYFRIESNQIVDRLKKIDTENSLEKYQSNLSQSHDIKRIINHKCQYDVEIIKYFF